ncbi:hypothetical protein C7E25_08455 [Stenotrophomonas maltophilia]|nr:hypothetical protein C7E24_04050 [Stenotrophomonas maltophilia]PSD49972.1 hypothetical protein C7E25_08455 [Stenotrophomonas maltophilia]
MSYQDCEQRLEKLIRDDRIQVIALSGAWGTGKTHLWNRIRETSDTAIVMRAVSVSLFGVGNVRELGLRIAQKILTGSDSEELRQQVATSWRWMKDALKSVHPGFEVLDELTNLAVPKLLEGRLLVIDDLERKHADLQADELLGFVDNCARALKCKVILILNAERFADDPVWQAFREKVIDEEVSLSITPAEAFETAEIASAKREENLKNTARAKGSTKRPVANTRHPLLPPDRKVLGDTLTRCGIVNIRVIQKLTRHVEDLVEELDVRAPPLRCRLVTAITLLGAIDLLALPQGPTTAYVLAHGRPATDPTSKASFENLAWSKLLDDLGIHASTELEEEVAAYIASRTRNTDLLAGAIQRYTSQALRLETIENAARFLREHTWEVNTPDHEFIGKLQALLPNVQHLDAETIDEVLSRARTLNGIGDLASRMASAWIGQFESKYRDDKEPFVMQWPRGALKNEEISKAVSEYQDWNNYSRTFSSLSSSIVHRTPLEKSDHYLMSNLTTEQVRSDLRRAQGTELQNILAAGLILTGEPDPSLGYAQSYAADKFTEACFDVIDADPHSRRAEVLRTHLIAAGFPEASVADTGDLLDSSCSTEGETLELTP